MAAVSFIDLGDKVREDPRGTSFFPWQGRVRDPRDLLDSFHLISITPGHTRGNHYHPRHAEWLYIFQGAGLLRWQEAGQVREREVAGRRTMINISPGVAHALYNPGPETIYLLAWREQAGEDAGEPETVPQPVAAGS